MAGCSGMGITLASFPPARAVIAAHARHLGRQRPAFARWATAAILAGHLTGAVDEDRIDRNIGLTAAGRQHLADEYASVLNRPDWTAVARASLKEEDDYSTWIAHVVAASLLGVTVDEQPACRRVLRNVAQDLPVDHQARLARETPGPVLRDIAGLEPVPQPRGHLLPPIPAN